MLYIAQRISLESLIFNGFNIGLTLSFILLTSAEMIGGNTGMGYYVKYYSDFGDYTRILAGIIVIGVVITVISTLFGALQKRLTRWADLCRGQVLLTERMPFG